MNKVSVLLIGGICILLGVASVAVGGVMKQEKLRQESEPLTAAAEVQQEMALSNIAMNDDAQVINGGSRDMWVRAKVEIPYINGEKAFDLVSHSITKEPEGKKNVWFLSDDGYYYYSEKVKPGEQSDSLFFKVKPLLKDRNILPHEDSVSVVAEAIQINWIEKNARTSMEAFDYFDEHGPVREPSMIGHTV